METPPPALSCMLPQPADSRVGLFFLGGGAAACKVTPRQPRHPRRERVLLGPGFLDGPAPQATVCQEGGSGWDSCHALQGRARGAGVVAPLAVRQGATREIAGSCLH